MEINSTPPKETEETAIEVLVDRAALIEAEAEQPAPEPAITTPPSLARGEALYDEVLEVLATNEILPAEQKFWDQATWRFPVDHPNDGWMADVHSPDRGRCGTTMCLAGTACDITGGRWLITITTSGPVDPAGKPVEREEALCLMSKLLAEPDDYPGRVHYALGYSVVDAEWRARRLLHLGSETPFYERADLTLLRDLRTKLYA